MIHIGTKWWYSTKMLKSHDHSFHFGVTVGKVVCVCLPAMDGKSCLAKVQYCMRTLTQ